MTFPQQHLLSNKIKIKQLTDLQYNFEPIAVKQKLTELFSENAKVQLCYPFEDLDGAKGLFDNALMPLFEAIADLERRDTIIISGITDAGKQWVGCCGYFCE